jgi:hypothetical protein
VRKKRASLTCSSKEVHVHHSNNGARVSPGALPSSYNHKPKQVPSCSGLDLLLGPRVPDGAPGTRQLGGVLQRHHHRPQHRLLHRRPFACPTPWAQREQLGNSLKQLMLGNRLNFDHNKHAHDMAFNDWYARQSTSHYAQRLRTSAQYDLIHCSIFSKSENLEKEFQCQGDTRITSMHMHGPQVHPLCESGVHMHRDLGWCESRDFPIAATTTTTTGSATTGIISAMSPLMLLMLQLEASSAPQAYRSIPGASTFLKVPNRWKGRV